MAFLPAHRVPLFPAWLPTAIRQLSTWPAGATSFSAATALLVILRTLSEGLSAPRDDLGGWQSLRSCCWRAAAAAPDRLGRPANDGLWRLPALIYLGGRSRNVCAALYKDAFLKFMLVASRRSACCSRTASSGLERALRTR